MKQTPVTKILILFLAIFLAVPAIPVAALPPQQTNLLANPGFESPYNADGAAGNWVRWDRVSSPDQFGDCTNGYHKSPRWGMATDFKHGGSASQYVGNNWDTWAGGVWQTVNVVPGTTYRFTFYGRGYGSMDATQPSYTGLNMNMRGGIDPNGSGLWLDSDVIWGASGSPHDTWQQFSVEATATDSKMTVFIAADWAVKGVNQCYQYLNTYYDDAALVEIAPPATNTPPPPPTSPPPPPATNTPMPPTATNTPAVTATNTPIPTDTPSPTPTGATLCLNAFADSNANGVNDESEGYMAGVTFTIANNGQVVGQVISTGSPDPVCLEGLAPGSYQIAQIVPARLEMTTAANTTLDISGSSSFGVEFGSRLRPADGSGTDGQAVANNPEPTPADAVPTTQPAPAEAGSRMSVLAISGLAVMLLAVIMLGVLIYLVLRQQTK